MGGERQGHDRGRQAAQQEPAADRPQVHGHGGRQQRQGHCRQVHPVLEDQVEVDRAGLHGV